jgi:exonuclease III
MVSTMIPQSQRCIQQSDINSRIWTSAGQLYGREIFVRYNWLCAVCRNLPPAIQNEQDWRADLPFQEAHDITFETQPQPQAGDKILREWLTSSLPQDFVKSRGLRFCHININSVRNKMEDIRLFLITLRIMVLACTESKLDSDRDKTEMFSVKGYTVIRTDRETDKGGGTIIYINDELNYEQLVTDFSDTPPLTELHVVKVWKTGLKPIIISSIYNHPKTYPSKFNIFLQQLHVFLSQYDGEKIIFGDFNMDLMKHKNTFDVNTHKYLLLNNEFGFKQVISGPTHRGISLLDHLHLNHPDKYGRTGHFQLSSSEHELVFCIRKQAKTNIPAKTVLCRNYKNVD